MRRPSLHGPAGSALTGIAAGAVTVGVAEFAAALWQRCGWARGTPSPVLALGAAFIDRTPPWLKKFAIAAFGTSDKTALLVSIALVVCLAAALAGYAAGRSHRAGSAIVVALAGVAMAAVLTRPNAGATDMVPVLIGAVVGLFVLAALRVRWIAARADPAGPTRRALLQALAASGALSGLAVLAGAALSRGAQAVAASRNAVRLPKPVRPGPSAAQLADLGTPGASRLLTPVADFYRIDTALALPQIPLDRWRLRVHGMVEQAYELSFAELLELPMIETMATLSCVSNEIGGDLVGNQMWLGHPIRELLARAKPSPGADMVLSTSADGWTAGTPLGVLTELDRDAVLAVGMGGQPLPVRHGFPARLVVPGLYGYVSATKWVVDLKVTRFDVDQGYWTPRGWAALGPIKTQSRIDVPRAGQKVKAGLAVVAGVAWAPHRGVQKVEVQVDDGPWQLAELGSGGTADSWRQWVWKWTATAGTHELRVRATDGTGQTQTETRTEVAPDGASGWHQVSVKVQ